MSRVKKHVVATTFPNLKFHVIKQLPDKRKRL